jgi:hypothetical protein
MHPAHIVEVFARLPVGSAGRFIYEPVLVAVTRDGIFLEAHRDIYGLAGGDVAGAVRAWAEARGTTGAIAWRTVDEVLTAREGVARRIGEIDD